VCFEPQRSGSQPRQRGFSLLESLIALLVLSVGSLGLLKMAVTGLSMARDSDHYVVASARAAELMDTIRVVHGPSPAPRPPAHSRVKSAPGWRASRTLCPAARPP